MRLRPLLHLALTAASAIALVPTMFMLVTALKSQEEYQADKTGLPDVFVLDHFSRILFDTPIFLWMANSLILVAGAVAVSLVVSCLAAYAIARLEFAGRDTIFTLSTALMAVPPVVLIVPMFVLYSQLGLISTYSGAIIIYAGPIRRSPPKVTCWPQTTVQGPSAVTTSATSTRLPVRVIRRVIVTGTARNRRVRMRLWSF